MFSSSLELHYNKQSHMYALSEAKVSQFLKLVYLNDVNEIKLISVITYKDKVGKVICAPLYTRSMLTCYDSTVRGGKSMGGRHERMETTKCQHISRRRRRYHQFPSSPPHAPLLAAVLLSKWKSLDRIGRRKLTSQYVKESGMRG